MFTKISSPTFFLILLSVLFITVVSGGGNVLVIPSMISPSHKLGMVRLADALAERGHDVLFWAPVAVEDKYVPKKASWKQPRGYAHGNEQLNNMFVHQNDTSIFEMPWTMTWSIPGFENVMTNMATPFCEDLLKREKKEFSDLLSRRWDLIIIDELFNPCGYLLTQLAKAPVAVYVSTSCLTRHSLYRAGLPSPRSYVPCCGIFTGYTDRMTFLQRTHNLLLWVAGYAIDHVSLWLSSRKVKAIYSAEYGGGGEKIDQNSALLSPDLTFFYYRYQVDYPQPMFSNLIHVGGLHIKADELSSKKSASPSLPANLAKAVEAGANGFILVATGHLAQLKFAPPATRKAFVAGLNRVAADGFSVIWQYAADASSEISGELAEGVYTFGWLPQRELLTHPKCKAFLSHCGCNSALEALNIGVPIIALGLFADQINSAALLQSKGICRRLDKTRLTEDVIYETIIKVATNQTIRAKAELYASILKQEPMDVMDKAVYWSEYVIRRKGAKWLKSKFPTNNLSSYIGYYCLDVIAVMMISLLSITIALIVFLTCLWRKFVR